MSSFVTSFIARHVIFIIPAAFWLRVSSSMWDLPLSSDSDGDDEGDVSCPVEPVRRKRGRPPGIFGSLRERQHIRQELARLGVHQDVVAAPLAPPRKPPGPVDEIAQHFQGFVSRRTGHLTEDLAHLVSRPVSVEDPDLGKVFTDLLGDSSRVLMGSLAHAKSLGMRPQTLQGHVRDVAACVHYSTRMWISSVCSRLDAEISSGRIRPIAMLTHIMYDETTYHMRTLSSDGKPRDVADMPSVDKGPQSKKAKGLSKVAQSELVLIFVFQPRGSAPVAWHIPVVAPLQVVDRGTAETLRTNIHRLLDIPRLAALQKKFMRVDSSTADRASANNKCEFELASEAGLPRFRMPCAAHICSTSQGHTFGTSSRVVSGIIHASLSQQDAEAVDKLRQAISLVLFHSCVPVDCSLPDSDDQRRRNLAAILDECLRKDPVSQRRRMKIWLNMVGDPASDVIYWCRPGGAHGADIWDWATKLASSLLPSAIAVFPRHRWIQALHPFMEYSLLQLHNVFHRAVPIWFDIIAGKNSGAMPCNSVSDVPHLVTSWELHPSDEEDDAHDVVAVAEPACDAAKLKPRAVTVEEKAAAKMSTKKFAAAQPRMELMVGLITMRVSTGLLHKIETLASEDWDRRQWSQFAATGTCSSRMFEAWKGEMAEGIVQHTQELFQDPSAWEALHSSERSYQASSLAFRMLSATICSLEHLLFRSWRCYPFKLWSIFTGGRVAAQQVLDDPPCIKDEWSRHFLEKFGDIDKLLGDGIAILSALSFAARYEITRIECRNAAIRRLTRIHASTHEPYVLDVSSDFILLRQRLLEKFFHCPPAAEEQKAKKTSDRKHRAMRYGKYKGTRSGGGGPQRYFMKKFITGQRFFNNDARKRALKEANKQYKIEMRCSSALWLECRRVGQVGTTAHQEGGVAFGSAAAESRKRRRQRQNEKVQNLIQSLPDKHVHDHEQGDACLELVKYIEEFRSQSDRKRQKLEDEQRQASTVYFVMTTL